MSNIPIEELEQKINGGEEVIDDYFDPKTTRVGRPHTTIVRRKAATTQTALDLPVTMLAELDDLAQELNISRDAAIKMMLRRFLDEHYLAKQHHR